MCSSVGFVHSGLALRYIGRRISHAENPTVLLFGADRWRIYIQKRGVPVRSVKLP